MRPRRAILKLLCAAVAHLQQPAAAQQRPPFLQLPEPDCEMDKATAIMQDTNAACDAGFAANQCDAPCALQMATLVDGECAKTITGIVDQQDRVPNGLAERIDAQWARCVRVPAPELVALLGEVSCSRGGGHRRLQGASAEDLLRAYAAGDGSVCALLVAAPAPADGAAVSELPRARSVCVGCCRDSATSNPLPVRITRTPLHGSDRRPRAIATHAEAAQDRGLGGI